MLRCATPVAQQDFIFALKARVKRNRRLATLVFWLTDLLYLDLAERRRFVSSFGAGERVFNMGAGFRNSPQGFWALDRESYPGVSLVGDLAALPLRSGSVDGILCEMVLEHVEEAPQALREFGRVLRPGGRMYLAVPFLWPYHASPHDYWRWTESGLAREMAGYEIVASGICGGPTTTLVNVAHEWLAMVLSLGSDLLYRVFYLLLMPLLFPWKILDLLVSRHPQAKKTAALLYVHARKSAGAPAGSGESPRVLATR
jgi:SAM-dependent methyltransferase